MPLDRSVFDDCSAIPAIQVPTGIQEFDKEIAANFVKIWLAGHLGRHHGLTLTAAGSTGCFLPGAHPEIPEGHGEGSG
jgi:hypothetical protein